MTSDGDEPAATPPPPAGKNLSFASEQNNSMQ